MKFLINDFLVKNYMICAVAMSKKKQKHIKTKEKKFKIKHSATMAHTFRHDGAIVLIVMS